MHPLRNQRRILHMIEIRAEEAVWAGRRTVGRARDATGGSRTAPTVCRRATRRSETNPPREGAHGVRPRRRKPPAHDPVISLRRCMLVGGLCASRLAPRRAHAVRPYNQLLIRHPLGRCNPGSPLSFSCFAEKEGG